MRLTSKQLAALAAAAEREGVDVDELTAAAEEMAAAETGEEADATRQHPTAERLLVGFLPFIKVRELRAIWLGLPDRVPDDEMTCGEYQLKHGGGGARSTQGDDE